MSCWIINKINQSLFVFFVSGCKGCQYCSICSVPISNHLHVRWVPDQEILSELQCQDRIHTSAWCICCSQGCKRSFYFKSQSIASTSSITFWWALQTQTEWVIFEPAITHYLGLKAQNFENPIFTFECFSLKAVYNSYKLQRLLPVPKFFFMYSFTHTNIVFFFSGTYLLKLSSS